MTINRVTIAGNLTREVELRRTQSGTAVLNMGVAVNNRRKNGQTGEWEDDPCYVDLVMFGERAEKISGYLHKGDKVAVDGKLRYSSWDARDGSGKRSKLEVVVDDIDFMTRKNAQGGSYGQPDGNAGGYSYGGGNAPQSAPQQPQGQYQREATYQPQQYQQQIDVNSSVYDEDIPF